MKQSKNWTLPEFAERLPKSPVLASNVPLCQSLEACFERSARLEQLAPLSSMALAQVTAKVSGVDCLVDEPVETPCHDLEVACSDAGPVELPCRDWEAV